MKLRNSFILLALFSLLSVAVGFVVSTRAVEQEIAQANQARYQSNQKTVAAAIESTSKLQKLFVRDYSYWDDMAQAVQDRNIEWISQEFFGPLEIYEADAVWVLDQSGEELYATKSSESTLTAQATQLPFAKSNITMYANTTDITTFFKKDSESGALVAYHVGPVLFHSQPEKNTAPLGFIIVAVHWDEELLTQLSTLVNAAVTVADHQPGASTDSSQNLAHPLTGFENNTVASINFVFGDTSVQLLSQHFQREIKQIGVLGALSILGTLILFQFVILQPINNLIKKLSHIAGGSQLIDEISKKSEITILQELIDQYGKQLHKIKLKNEQIKESDSALKALVHSLKISETQAKRELRTSLKLAKAVDAATDAIVITDTEGHIEYVNAAWETLNGYTFKEVEGKKPSLLKSGRTNTTLYTRLWNHITQGLTFSSEEVINKKKDGSLYAAHVSIFPVIENGKVTNYVGMVQDISERKQREHLRSEFVSLASHQLRTPLTSLRWLSEMLRKRARKLLGSTELDILKNIEVSAMRMISLVNRLLNLSRIESGRLNIKAQRTDLVPLIKDIRKTILPLITDKKQKLNLTFDASLPVVSVDRELLHEILINLLSNSAKYTPSGGTIALSVQKTPKTILFTVSDTGIGIPKADQEHIFDRFFRASNAIAVDQQGTGLGLYLVNILVNSLGGEITLESEENKGTKVAFYIPRIGAQKRGEVTVIKSKV